MTVCPVRLIDPDTSAFVDWFLRELSVNPYEGAHIRHWPRGEGVANEPAKLVAAVDLLMNEMHYLPKREKKAG